MSGIRGRISFAETLDAGCKDVHVICSEASKPDIAARQKAGNTSK